MQDDSDDQADQTLFPRRERSNRVTDWFASVNSGYRRPAILHSNQSANEIPSSSSQPLSSSSDDIQLMRFQNEEFAQDRDSMQQSHFQVITMYFMKFINLIQTKCYFKESFNSS